MTNPSELRKQQYQRLNEIFALARQRYLDEGGDPQQSSGSHKGKDYLTEEEKQEISQIGKQLFPAASQTKADFPKV